MRPIRSILRLIACLLALPMIVAIAGCLERRVSITSEPPGALVYANDVELGRTPLEADFTYYGDYDVRVELEGFEPLRTRARADTPLYEVPPFDLVATALPVPIETTVRWHFGLEPALETRGDKERFEAGLIGRAKQLRDELNPPETDRVDGDAPTEEAATPSALEEASTPDAPDAR
jgi:PEGA domain